MISAFSVLFSVLSFLFYKIDSNFQYKYLTLFFYFLSIFVVFLPLIIKNIKIDNFISKKNLCFLIIILVSVLSRTLLLKNYPFVSIGDEVRDGGINAVKINQGMVKDIFNYDGYYNTHGLIIPAFNSIFVSIFGLDNLSYRFPSAILGILDTCLLFLLIGNIFNYQIGFWSALILSSLPLHLFYSRTETVVIFSSFLATLLLTFSLKLIKDKKQNIQNYIYLSLLIGVCMNFHSSIKGLAFILLPFMGFLIVLKRKFFLTKKYRILMIPAFIIIGFGPKLLVSNFQTISQFDKLDSQIKPKVLMNNYLKSLSVISISPTTSHYLDHRPILNPLLSVFFIYGLICLFYYNHYYLVFFLYLIFSILFFNSAITDWVNADHRIISIIPILSAIVGFGIYSFLNIFRKMGIKSTVTMITLILVIYSIFRFFIFQQANTNDYNDWRHQRHYLAMHLIYFIKNNESKLSNNLCILASPYNSQNYNYLHYQEQRQYFLPNYQIKFESNHNVGDNQLIIYKDDCPIAVDYNQLYSHYVDCQHPENKLYCPINFKDKLTIYY